MRIPETEPPVFYNPDENDRGYIREHPSVTVEDIQGTESNGAKMVSVQAWHPDAQIATYETRTTIGGLREHDRAEILGGYVLTAQELLVGNEPQKPLTSEALKALQNAALDSLRA